MQVVVLNKHTDPVEFYRNTGWQIIDIMRPGPYGNPYPVKRYGRLPAIARYRDDFAAVHVQRLYEAVKSSDRVALLCCCKPEPCHGDVLALWLQAMDSQQRAKTLDDVLSRVPKQSK